VYTVAQEQRALAALMDFEHALLEEERDLRSALHLGTNDVTVLRLVVDAEADDQRLTPGEVARTLGTSSAATTAIVDRLEAAGLLERTPHPTDRRSVVLSPTMAEDSPARAALTASRRRREAMVEMLSPAEREAMASALSQLADSLAGRRSDALSG
jgi:DNA-binding MarR family transcriptional regulator